jgi:hypothetical protein
LRVDARRSCFVNDLAYLRIFFVKQRTRPVIIVRQKKLKFWLAEIEAKLFLKFELDERASLLIHLEP